jgi:uncharacterized membrane protein
MRFIKRCFFSGLPIVATIGIVAWAFGTLDGLLAGPQKVFFKWALNRDGYTVPGLGVLLILITTFALGLLVSSFLTKWLMAIPGRIFERLPLVKMIYGSIKDLFEAFVGDKKSFNKPVLVQLIPGGSARMVGFVTNEDLSVLGIKDDVAVYLPQSYNFAGNMIVVPREAVTPMNAESGDVMKFIVSGGVSSSKTSSNKPRELPEGE